MRAICFLCLFHLVHPTVQLGRKTQIFNQLNPLLRGAAECGDELDWPDLEDDLVCGPCKVSHIRKDTTASLITRWSSRTWTSMGRAPPTAAP